MATTQSAMITRERLERLLCAQEDLQQELAGLLGCMAKQGLVSETELKRGRRLAEPIPVSEVELHRRRFRATLERYPLAQGGPAPALADALAPAALRRALRCCGEAGEELLALKQANPCFRERVNDVQAEKIYAFGGMDACFGNALKASESFDVRKGRWEAVPSMAIRRFGSAAGVVCGRIYVCGGVGEFGQIVEIFNPRLRSWERQRPLRRLRCRRVWAAAASVGGRLYVSGGEDSISGEVHRSIECIGPEGSECELLAGQATWPRRCHAATVAPGKEHALLLTGGLDTPVSVTSSCGPVLDTVEAFDLAPSSGRSRLLAPLLTPRSGHGAASLGGIIYVCGGYTRHFQGMADFATTVERLDPATGTWAVVQPMGTKRGMTGVAAVGGCLYVFGGIPCCRTGVPSLSSMERLDPGEEGAWERLPSVAGLLTARHDFSTAVVKVRAVAA